MGNNTVKITRKVEESGLACMMKSGSLPVLATPQLVAWMEEAACACLHLEEGKTSVGIKMDMSHTAPSPLGAEIEIEAVLVLQEKRRLVFDVRAAMAGTEIGFGRHERAIVDVDRFMARLKKG